LAKLASAHHPVIAMNPTGSRGDRDEAFWRDYLTRGSSAEHYARRFFKHIPSDPRCRLCAAPFAGAGAPVMRLLGRPRSNSSPNMCDACNVELLRHHGGAEIDGSLLFADIRGSTTLAESMSPSAFHDLLDRFYTTATKVVFDHDGAIDKFVGDELVAMFVPLLTGERHAARAVEAAQALLRATGHADPGGPWLPVGAGVNSGRIWFGAVGEGEHTELTALGDRVNVTARLASVAQAGEILVTREAAAAAGLDPRLERRSLELKGKVETTEVVTLRVGP
jgi:adenylate cyclase